MSILDKTAQAVDAVAVTPSDTLNVTDSNNRQRITDGISVGVSGNVRVTLAGISDQVGADVVLAGLGAGIVHPIRAIKIWATNTTATSINAYFT